LVRAGFPAAAAAAKKSAAKLGGKPLPHDVKRSSGRLDVTLAAPVVLADGDVLELEA
jgi:hypothetical protein